MKVTCLAIGDPHFRVDNTEDAKALIEKVNFLVDQLQPTFVVILGDLLHTHERVHTKPLKLATDLITSLATKAPVYLIIGNHDYCNNQQFLSDNHAFNSFKEIDNVTICDNVIIDKIGGLKFVFCPYTPPERFEEALNTVEEKGGKWDDATCIFAHQEFYGCRFNPTKISTNGDIWPEEYPLVVSGHIHDEQWLQDNIYYTGSSIQHSYAENAKKTVALLTFAPKKKVQVQKIDLEMRKRKIIYLDIEKVEDFKPPTGNVHVKLTLLGTPEQFKIFRKSKTFKKLHALGLAISFNPKKPNHQLPTTLETQRQPLFDILEDLIKEDNEYVQEAYQELVSD